MEYGSCEMSKSNFLNNLKPQSSVRYQQWRCAAKHVSIDLISISLKWNLVESSTLDWRDNAQSNHSRSIHFDINWMRITKKSVHQSDVGQAIALKCVWSTFNVTATIDSMGPDLMSSWFYVTCCIEQINRL